MQPDEVKSSRTDIPERKPKPDHSDRCQICGDQLSPLNATEENDFATYCDDCRQEQSAERFTDWGQA